jgi:L-ascorbate metabolism protein UlaG (beta-lactamase superfamily)
MDIIYLGHSSFKLSGRSISVVMDPYETVKSGFKFSKVSADVVTVSHEHYDHNRHDLVSEVRKVIDGPGEYEIDGVSFIGLPTYHDTKKGEERGRNTIFVVEMDGVRLLHLGDLGHKLDEKSLSAIGGIDVLMVPVGGFYTIDSAVAVEVVRSIEPKFIIPMHYSLPGGAKSELATYEAFVTALGIKSEEMAKLSVKPADLIGDDQLVVILQKK